MRNETTGTFPSRPFEVLRKGRDFMTWYDMMLHYIELRKSVSRIHVRR